MWSCDSCGREYDDDEEFGKYCGFEDCPAVQEKSISGNWQPISTAPEGVVLDTKIDDGMEVRNGQKLKRRGNLWWLPDGSMYVYYTPTHWRRPT